VQAKSKYQQVLQEKTQLQQENDELQQKFAQKSSCVLRPNMSLPIPISHQRDCMSPVWHASLGPQQPVNRNRWTDGRAGGRADRHINEGRCTLNRWLHQGLSTLVAVCCRQVRKLQDMFQKVQQENEMLRGAGDTSSQGRAAVRHGGASGQAYPLIHHQAGGARNTVRRRTQHPISESHFRILSLPHASEMRILLVAAK
jgi:hypothetical protein